MGVLKLHNLSVSKSEIIKERENRYLKLSPSEKFYSLLNLINVSIKLNGGSALKQPQGKGIIISKPL